MLQAKQFAMGWVMFVVPCYLHLQQQSAVFNRTYYY